jgi:diadenosine tetraphosphatase ApaH/serine/threonine PP2A family protein phosphatase
LDTEGVREGGVIYLIISDIHGNIDALDATLADAGACDHVLVLGDLVGYGADPNAVIERVRSLTAVTLVRGNHDKVAAGVATVDGFNRVARLAIEWTMAALTPVNKEWLAALPQGPAIVTDDIEICHGATYDEDEYIFGDQEALRSLEGARRRLCLFGHTHVPAIYLRRGSSETTGLDVTVPVRGFPSRLVVEDGARFLVNCGAVGQPRDLDARAAFGVYDTSTRTLTIRRAAYDITAAQRKIVDAGLPEVLAHRLAVGR